MDFDYVGGNLCKHPSRNLIVQPFRNMDYIMFFDYDGNFLKSVKLDTHVSRMTYDEKNHILYTVDFNTDSLYSYDLVSF